MFDFSSLLISKAVAATATAPVAAPAVDAAAASNSSYEIMSAVRFFLILFVCYFFLIHRPQRQKEDRHNLLIKALKKGDKVITSGGIVGTVTKLEGDLYLIVEIAKGVEIKVMKSSVSNLADDVSKDIKDAKAK